MSFTFLCVIGDDYETVKSYTCRSDNMIVEETVTCWRTVRSLLRDCYVAGKELLRVWYGTVSWY